MIDFHSHILPGIDDGAPDVETSLKMLSVCNDGGIETVLMTPHCHPMSQEKIDNFLKKRDVAFELLSGTIKKEKVNLPKIIPAAEVHIYDGLHKLSELEKLCIKDTNYMLLEMPYGTWKDYAFEEIYQLTRLGFRPIMAHIDRFLDQEKSFGEIFSLGVEVQINSSAFSHSNTRKKMLKLFESGHVQVLGSDAHNLSDRKPDVASAYNILEKKFGKEYVDYINNSGNAILKNGNVKPSNFSKAGILKKMFI